MSKVRPDPPPPGSLLAHEAELYRRSLRRFIKAGWHVLEPAQEFVPNWHIDAVCEHLEAVTRGQIRQLIINIPPGFMKSLTTCVFWPAWEWASRPHVRWLFSSYDTSFALRDSVKCRDLILSPWYQARWGHRFALKEDVNLKSRFENDKTGLRLAVGVGGGTGERAHRIVVDDPHKIADIESAAAREYVRKWWKETMSQRVADPSTSAKVIIMQRLHQGDLTGILLRDGDWDVLCLPMEYEPATFVVNELGQEIAVPRSRTSIGFVDQRTQPGELLWPARFPREVVEKQKRDLGSYGAAGQLQQRPAPAGGGKFKREWFEIVRDVPVDALTVRAWDLAATEAKPGSDPDYTVGVKMALKDGVYYVVDVRRDRLSPGAVEALLRQTAMLDGPEVGIYPELEGGASGKMTMDHLQRRVLLGYAVFPAPPSGSKEVRAFGFAAAAEAGNVKLVEGPWNEAYLDELELFPFGDHDDQVDASSNAFHQLARAHGAYPLTPDVPLPAHLAPRMRGIRSKEF